MVTVIYEEKKQNILSDWIQSYLELSTINQFDFSRARKLFDSGLMKY